MTLPTIVSFVAASSTADTTNTVVTLPTNAAGDMIFIAISSDLPDEVYTAPTNYATVYPIINIRSAASNKASAALFVKQSTGSEPSTVTIPQTLADKQSWAVLVVRGANGIHNKTNPPVWGDSALATIPSIVTTVADCLLMAIIATDGNTTPHSGATNYTKRAESTTSGASSISLWTNTAPTAGTQAADTATLPTEQWIGYTLALSENFVMAVTDAIALSESVGVLIYTPGVTLAINVSDGVTLSDSVDFNLSVPDAAISNTVTVTESVAVSVALQTAGTDSITLSEAISISSIAVRVSVSDAISIGEQANASVPGLSNTQVVINDAVALSEQVTMALNLYLLSVSDAVTVTEVIITGGTKTTTASDTVTLSETIQVILAHLVNVSETITLTDAVAALEKSDIRASEDVIIAESASGSTSVQISTADTVTITETVSYGDRFLINVSESITLTDSVIIPEILLIPTLRDYRIGTDAANTFGTVMTVPTAQAKDYVFIAITSDAVNQIFTPPDGFVLIVSNNIFSAASYAIFYKLSTGIEPATYTMGVSISERQSWAVFTVANAAVPINAISGVSFGNDNLPRIPEVTTTVDSSLVLGFIATNGYPAPYHNTGTFYNEQYEAGGSSAGSISVWRGYKEFAGATPEDSINATGIQPWNGFALALAPLINRLVFPSDTITLGESTALIVSDPQAQAVDTITVTETIKADLALNVSISESAITVTDEVVAERFYNITVPEEVTVTETVGTVMAQNIKISVVNTVTVTETKTINVQGLPYHPVSSEHITVGELVTLIVITGRTVPNPFGRCCGRIKFRGTVSNQGQI